MAGFKAALINELFKLLKKKKLLAAAVFSVLAVMIGQLAVMVIEHGFGLRVAAGAEFPLMVLSVLIYTLLPLFATFAAIDMFSGEFSSNTMKITLTRPVSRLGVFTAKVATTAFFILVNLFFVMVLSLVVGMLFHPASATLAGILRVMTAYAATFLPVFVFSLLVILLANLIRGGVAVFFLSVLLFIAFNILGIVYSSLSSFFITSTFDWYTLWIAERVNWAKIGRQILLMSGCGIMLFTAGYVLFDRKDL